MYADTNLPQNALFQYLCVDKSLKKVKFARSRALSLKQIYFLALSSTLGKNPLRSLYFNKFGMSLNLSYYYLRSCASLGYLDKVGRGKYIFNDQSRQLLTDFQSDLHNRLSHPLTW